MQYKPKKPGDDGMLLEDQPDSSLDNSDLSVEDLDTSDNEDGFKKLQSSSPDEPDKEYDDALAKLEAMGSQSEDQQQMSQSPDRDLASVPDAPQQTMSPLDQYKNYLQEYKALQEQRRKSDLVTGLIAAGGKIGQSIAGKYSGQFNPDMSGVQMLQNMANRPVTDFEQGQIVQGRGLQLQSQTAAADPASSQSKLVRDYLNEKVLKSLNMHLGPEVSANDAMILMKTVGKPGQTKFGQQPMVNQKTGEQTMAIFNPTTGTFTDVAGNPMGPEWVRNYRAQSFVDPSTQERVGFSGGTGKLTGPLTGPGINRPTAPAAEEGQSVDLNRTLLTAQQSKQLDHTRDKFLGEVKNDRAAINSADRVIQVLKSGKIDGDLPAEIQDQMSRAFGQTGHITDAQMGRALGRADWQSKLKGALSMYTQGKIDDENRQFLTSVMTTIRDQNQQFVNNKSKVYSENLANDFKSSPNLKKYNVTPESINKLLGVEAASSSQQSAKKDPKVEKFAKEHTDNDYEKAKAILVKRGYKPQE